MGTLVTVSEYPPCDFAPCTRRAQFDFKTNQGPWANGCPKHYRQYRAYPTLGTGKGQKLVVLKTVRAAAP